MNGFLKTPIQLLTPALKCDGAYVVLDGEERAIDMAAVNAHALDQVGAWKNLNQSEH
jgi:L-Ala-D/L-Glu epimerase